MTSVLRAGTLALLLLPAGAALSASSPAAAAPGSVHRCGSVLVRNGPIEMGASRIRTRYVLCSQARAISRRTLTGPCRFAGFSIRYQPAEPVGYIVLRRGRQLIWFRAAGGGSCWPA
ncbi:MAG: hypothetical protein U0R70_16385 [Solirubrobacteraceae bacterium]